MSDLLYPCTLCFASQHSHYLLQLYTTVFKLSVRYYNCLVYFISRRDGSVGIALGYGLDDRGSRVRFPAGGGSFPLHRVQNGSGAHPASYPMGTRSFFSGGETDHTPPCIAFVAWCSVKPSNIRQLSTSFPLFINFIDLFFPRFLLLTHHTHLPYFCNEPNRRTALLKLPFSCALSQGCQLTVSSHILL
jgi:hypothetical protein